MLFYSFSMVVHWHNSLGTLCILLNEISLKIYLQKLLVNI